MPKQKNTIAKAERKQSALGIGVFLMVIALLWFASFKLIGGSGGRTSEDKGIFNFGTIEEEEIKPVFGNSKDYPVFIVFDNHPDSQAYLSGLQEALVVYEYLAEGGATRFAGLYNGAPSGDRIGPIRSARPYIVEIASGWSGFFWHAGGSPEALELVKKTDAIDLNEISGLGIRYFWRDNEVPRPHNLFTSSDLIGLGIEDFELNALPSDKILWQWDQDNSQGSIKSAEERGQTIDHIYVDFSEGIDFDASYKYDPIKNHYKRFMGGLEHIDYATGEQITTSNIIIQKVPQEGYYASGLGRIKLDMIGTGKMILFQNGKVIKGTWEKEFRDSQTIWLNEISEPITLERGQTWVEVVPGARLVTYE
tara:strand:+ start:13149 stop:14243 length:1095 start_codon:yes stop_codon:yes gene_type:complete